MSESNPQPPTYTKRTRSKTPIVIGVIILVGLIAAVAAYFALTRPTSGDDTKELSVGLVLEPTSLDVRNDAGVATGQVLIDNVYQGLVGIEAGSIADIVPVLATEMPEVSADGLEYTFTLRSGVTFHSGAEFTADDVVASLEPALTADSVGFDAQVTKVDDNTVRIALEQPNSRLLWELAGSAGVILEGGSTDGLQNSANGTGPFEFTRWKQGDSITLDKFAGYWGEPALVDRATFRFFPEGRAAVNALKDGDIDVHTALLSPLRAEFEGNANFDMVRAESADVFTLAYNSARAPFDDPRVRQALSMAIDGEALVASQNGDAVQLGSPITELEPGYVDLTKVNGYDPEAARALLAEAGQSNLSLTITSPNFYDTAALDMVTSQLAEVGVSAKVKPVEFPTWLNDVYSNHDFDLSYVDHAEARDLGNYANPGYYFGYDNPEVQRLYAESLASTDAGAEAKLLEEAAGIIAEDAPAKWLFNYTPTNVISTKVSGFPSVNTNARVSLAGVSID
ncbi:peptide/nickel transport system substrate-binding protein [Mycolicibacterium mucogenicum 261Sha1.1M5]|uniref:Peptide/nickel transport system substrate-binding protein n=1 Tax=Leucobacter aridicollis TaxID=283878 RepID=A0A852R7D5_9MICO|nr:ABC transporter substrate-binding protein [Leucobacter aridicollis]MBL3682900.1 ABC transporter substrate-binding protein [Leucobacter aridicollis]NYD26339.1 peptide/nickel transport system substrate-binding protein [Leucobacter aridicollis]RKQ85249.1 peptide/nickel transport system substrate-binding protein [Mycolicibacterium mucogenicum 261Sha1.1M5]